MILRRQARQHHHLALPLRIDLDEQPLEVEHRGVRVLAVEPVDLGVAQEGLRAPEQRAPRLELGQQALDVRAQGGRAVVREALDGGGRGGQEFREGLVHLELGEVVGVDVLGGLRDHGAGGMGELGESLESVIGGAAWWRRSDGWYR